MVTICWNGEGVAEFWLFVSVIATKGPPFPIPAGGTAPWVSLKPLWDVSKITAIANRAATINTASFEPLVCTSIFY
jgi:hypothetical protein